MKIRHHVETDHDGNGWPVVTFGPIDDPARAAWLAGHLAEIVQATIGGHIEGTDEPDADLIAPEAQGIEGVTGLAILAGYPAQNIREALTRAAEHREALTNRAQLCAHRWIQDDAGIITMCATCGAERV